MDFYDWAKNNLHKQYIPRVVMGAGVGARVGAVGAIVGGTGFEGNTSKSSANPYRNVKRMDTKFAISKRWRKHFFQKSLVLSSLLSGFCSSVSPLPPFGILSLFDLSLVRDPSLSFVRVMSVTVVEVLVPRVGEEDLEYLGLPSLLDLSLLVCGALLLSGSVTA